ncbi:hypothetical protein, partial [Bacteroides acidifaciens]|uniref:hypothetical protein n=1 Tax=Bacteroides acidifaciens TaxID=85831 RepID=UPI0025B14767
QVYHLHLHHQKGNKVITIKNIKIMKRYFVNGKEISEQEAKAIEAKNQDYMNSTDFSLWAKCEFIIVINE